MAHSKTCSYCDAARSHDMSCDMPLCIIPSHESLCSRYVRMAVHSACQAEGEDERQAPSTDMSAGTRDCCPC